MQDAYFVDHNYSTGQTEATRKTFSASDLNYSCSRFNESVFAVLDLCHAPLANNRFVCSNPYTSKQKGELSGTIFIKQ